MARWEYDGDRGLMAAKITDTRRCVVRIKESSSAEEACVWIFTDDPNGVYSGTNPAPHLNKRQAMEVAVALIEFCIREETDDRLE